MSRFWLMVGLALIVVGVLVSLEGLAVIYEERTSPTREVYVTVAGHEYDAGVAGPISLYGGIATFVIGVFVVSWRRFFAKPS
jgi:hypothetical protein